MPSAHSSEICTTSAIQLAEAVRARKVSPVEVVEAVLARIGEVNPRVNACCTVAADRAMDAAREADCLAAVVSPVRRAARATSLRHSVV